MKRVFKQNLIAAAVVAFVGLPAVATHANTIAYWKFEPGNLTADSSGNGYTLTNNNVTGGSAAPTMPGSTGSASFNGTNSQLILPSGLNLATGTGLTYEWFMKPNLTPGSTQIVFEVTSNLTNSGSHSVFGVVSGDGATTVLSVAEFGTGYTIRDTPGFPPALAGEWHHYAFTVDGSQSGADRLALYVDGTLMATSVTFNAGGAPSFLNSTDFYIGARGAGPSLWFNGLIDDLRISNKVLSPPEFLINIPEPSSLVLLGLGGIGLIRLRRRKQAARVGH